MRAKTRMIAAVLVVAWLLAVAVGRATGQPSGSGTPKAPVSLAASVSVVKPGDAFEVALVFEVADGWHIYWKNPGDSGAPPQVAWRLPEGFTAGDLRFPPPHRMESGPEDFRLVTYALEGQVVLLATMTAPASLPPSGTVTIGAEVTTLVCREQCLMERAQVAATLPVASASVDVQPANAELFENARKLIPPEDGKGGFVTVAAAAAVESTEIGGEFELAVNLDIRSGFHIQSHRPYIPGLIATEVIYEPTPGVEFGTPVYPQPKERYDRVLRAKISEFADRVAVRIPVTVTPEAVGTSLPLAGIVTVQACDEKSGRCYPPETVGWSTSVALTGAPPAPAGVASSEPGGGQPAAPQEAAGTGTKGVSSSPPSAAAAPAAEEESLSLPAMLVLALLGGVILNVMPCVWPVISIKILSFVQQAHDDPKRTLRLGALFALGILVSFWILGLVAVGARTAVGGPTWGTQFAHPAFVVAITVILFVFGMSLFGVFEVNLPGAAAGKLSAATTREGYAGSFLKGMLATVLATPCTAPLLGPAIAFAFTQSAAVIMLAMTAIGLGMSLPYVILAAKPAWLGFLPRPGPWMETFKQFTGFLMMGVVVALLWVLGKLTGASGVVAMTAFLTVLGLACWIYGNIKMTWSTTARLSGAATALAVAVFGGWLAGSYLYTPPADTPVVAMGEGGLPVVPSAADWQDDTPWLPQAPGLHERLAAAGHTVFVNYTAAWCTKCIIQKKTVLETDPVRERMRDLGVVPVKADFTAKPDWMAEELKSYGAAGVPLNVILPAGRPHEPIVLPESIGKDLVLEKLSQAGPSEPADAPTRLTSREPQFARTPPG